MSVLPRGSDQALARPVNEHFFDLACANFIRS